jgi:hypothetical protein
MLKPIISIRDRYHSLFDPLKLSAFHWLIRPIDVPLTQCDPVSHPDYFKLSKNLSSILARGRELL